MLVLFVHTYLFHNQPPPFGMIYPGYHHSQIPSALYLDCLHSQILHILLQEPDCRWVSFTFPIHIFFPHKAVFPHPVPGLSCHTFLHHDLTQVSTRSSLRGSTHRSSVLYPVIPRHLPLLLHGLVSESLWLSPFTHTFCLSFPNPNPSRSFCQDPHYLSTSTQHCPTPYPTLSLSQIHLHTLGLE